MFLERIEEISDSLEDDDERILARNNVFCGLYGFDIRLLRAREIQDDNFRKDTGTSENDICRWEYLDIRFELNCRKSIWMEFTSPTHAVIAREDRERTLTIGSIHIIKFSSADSEVVCSDCASAT